MKETAAAPTAADTVYRQLKKQIISRRRQPGDRLREETIAKELDVSRTPVREAIRRLTAEGLATLVPNAGARLIQPTRQEIVDTFEVRETLECLAARKAAASATAEQLNKLQELIDEEERIFAQKNFEAYLDVNTRFHRALAAAAGNPVLARVIGNLATRASVFMYFSDAFFDMQTNPSLDEHRALLKALRARDGERAASLMRVHLTLSATALQSGENETESGKGAAL